MGQFFLPAEGMTLEFFSRTFSGVFLQPLVVGVALLAMWKDPIRFSHLVSHSSKGRVTLLQVQGVLKVLFALGVAHRLNKALTESVLNNFSSDETWDWDREIALVTGGSSGIGRLIIDKLSEQGIQVIVFDVVDPKQPFPSTTRFYKVDITSPTQIRATAEQVRKDVGHPSILVNNAGVGFNTEIMSQSEQQIRLTFEVNILAHFWLVREFVPDMIKKNHGHVVTIASLASFMVHAGNVDYASTKAAALAFHEGLSQELKARYGAKKVRTTVVHPTWVRTPLIESLFQDREFHEFVLEPDTVAEAVVAQIRKAKSAQLILPGRYGLMSGVRVLPGWMQEILRNSVANLLRNPEK